MNISKYRNTESIHSDKLKKSYRISLNEKYKSTIFYTIVYVSRIILFIITYSLLLTMHNFKVSTIIGMYIEQKKKLLVVSGIQWRVLKYIPYWKVTAQIETYKRIAKNYATNIFLKQNSMYYS